MYFQHYRWLKTDPFNKRRGLEPSEFGWLNVVDEDVKSIKPMFDIPPSGAF
jgi:hypothetical protein